MDFISASGIIAATRSLLARVLGSGGGTFRKRCFCAYLPALRSSVGSGAFPDCRKIREAKERDFELRIWSAIGLGPGMHVCLQWELSLVVNDVSL